MKKIKIVLIDESSSSIRVFTRVLRSKDFELIGNIVLNRVVNE